MTDEIIRLLVTGGSFALIGLLSWRGRARVEHQRFEREVRDLIAEELRRDPSLADREL